MRILLLVFLLVAFGFGCSESSSIQSEEEENEKKEAADSTEQNAMENYKPSQPIEFSHSIHAGDNGIDCKYCHNSVSKSKTAGIPTVNVCMNCHKTISGDNPTKEIQKLYDAAGYDSKSRSYTGDTHPMVWEKTIQKEYDNFSHKLHIDQGASCASCHDQDKSGQIDEWACAKCHY